MMFGEVKIQSRPKDIKIQDENIMEVKGFSRTGWYQDVNFELHRGEVLGIAGMLGSGRTELLRGIFGADPVDEAKIMIEGKVHKNVNPIKMVKAGVGTDPGKP